MSCVNLRDGSPCVYLFAGLLGLHHLQARRGSVHWQVAEGV